MPVPDWSDVKKGVDLDKRGVDQTGVDKIHCCKSWSAQAWKLLRNVHAPCIQCPSMYTPPVCKEWPSSSSSVQGVSKLVNMLCTNWALAWARVNFQAVSKLGHSNFYSSDGSRQNGSRANGKTPQKQS